MAYPYDALQSHKGGPCVRLVCLQPAKQKRNRILCHLLTVPLHEAPVYEALSYCWGEPKKRLSIFCNGIPFATTSNLESALRHLRRESEERVLWIDAICINQEDNNEKEQQVRIMGDVYRKASQVVVWLGTAGDDSTLVFELCRRHKEGSLVDLDPNHTHDGSPADSRTRIFKASLTDESGQLSWVHALEMLGGRGKLERFLDRPWWGRVWVIQEVCLAAKVTVLCGDASINWDDLRAGVRAILCQPSGGTMRRMAFHLVTTMLESRRPDSEWRQSGPFAGEPTVALLNRFRWSHATDPRDKVYALLSLCQTGPGQPAINIDYRSDTEGCYRDASLAIMAATGNLDILQLCRLPPYKHESPFPSWIPDLSDNASTAPSAYEVRRLESPSLQLRLDRVVHDVSSTSRSLSYNFRASKGSRCAPKLRQDGKTLVLEGIVFDTLTEVGDMLPEVDTSECSRNFTTVGQFVHADDPSILQFMGNVGNLALSAIDFSRQIGSRTETLVSWRKLAFSSDRYPTGEPMEQVFYSVLHQGAGHDDIQQRTLEFEAKWQRSPAGDPPWFRKMAIPAVREFVEGARLSQPNALNTSMDGMLFYDRFSRSSKGYLAQCPPQSRRGDQIALLRGGTTPFVVRQHGSQWQLVGDCYVHGLMYGEQWSEGACCEMDFL